MISHKIFISYHRKDDKYKEKIEDYLSEQCIDYYAVSEDDNYDGMTHKEIKDKILENMEDCDIVICIVGDETYERPHVDWELHKSLKGGPGVRRGLIVVMLEYRQDSINDIDYSTFPSRLEDNEQYIVLKQYATIDRQLIDSIDEAYENRNNIHINVKNNRKIMELRDKVYYDKWEGK